MRKKKNGGLRLERCRELIVRSRGELPRLPVSLEIGCGKGGFICRMARLHPEREFVCCEICSDVAVLAAERVIREGIRNVHFIVDDAKNLGSYFRKGEVEEIYLNFSDPWTKSGQYKRRLTYRSFLFIYKSIMRDGAGVFFKTDDERLFDFSLDEFAFAGFELRGVTRDLHASEFAADNVMTEYETNFSSRGIKINRVEAVLPAAANVSFRPARESDVEAYIIPAFEAARGYLCSRGVDQWQDGYPDRAAVEGDLASGRAYVLETSGRAVAYAALCFGDEPTYAEINGAWKNDLPYAAVHRVAVADGYKGMGLAGQLFSGLEAAALERGVSELRCDTHADNRSMRRHLEKCGFEFCGGIRLANGDPRLAYQKHIG